MSDIATCPHERVKPLLPPVDFRAALYALPTPVYMIDTAGHLTFFNEAAAALWGDRPVLGREVSWHGWRLSLPDGQPLAIRDFATDPAFAGHGDGRSKRILAERPDGTRMRFEAATAPILDDQDGRTGTIIMLTGVADLVEADEQQGAYQASQQLAAIVESSADAILSKNLDGIIQSWNAGARRLFGYLPEEVIGKSVTILIPEDRLDEEPGILARIRRGERIQHYETVRRRKDGSLVDISLSVSPIHDSEGRVVGASKIARDISARRTAEQQRELLLREMNHRIKNLFTLASSVVSLSARKASDVPSLVEAVRDRLAALAQAHALTVGNRLHGVDAPQTATLHALARTILSPYEDNAGQGRVEIVGADAAVGGPTLTGFALLLHEFATNAAKYGALSTPAGRVRIEFDHIGDQLRVSWTETGGPPVEFSGSEGFGSLISRATIEGQLGGEMSREWRPDGLVVRFSVPADRLAAG